MWNLFEFPTPYDYVIAINAENTHMDNEFNLDFIRSIGDYKSFVESEDWICTQNTRIMLLGVVRRLLTLTTSTVQCSLAPTVNA